jgi:hypothetical protein
MKIVLHYQSFYQSLIKKRIVMLNKINQKKSKSLKYAIINAISI